MYNFIYLKLSKFLPDELIYLIFFYYAGLKHPISHICLKENKLNQDFFGYTTEKNLIYKIWTDRKNNNFTDESFKCYISLGNLKFVQNKTKQICDARDVLREKQYHNYVEKYGLIHYFNYKWLFPLNCNKNTLITEVSKNIEPSKINSCNLEDLTRKELINLYFKL